MPKTVNRVSEVRPKQAVFAGEGDSWFSRGVD